MKTAALLLPFLLLACSTPPRPAPPLPPLPPPPRPSSGARPVAKTALPPATTPTKSTVSPSVTLAWDISPDPRVAGYNVYEGNASRNYTNTINAGATNALTVRDLVRGATYFFAATCYATNGLESDYSVEVSYSVPAPLPPPTGLNIIVLTVQASTNLVNWATVLGPEPMDASAPFSFYRSVISRSAP